MGGRIQTLKITDLPQGEVFLLLKMNTERSLQDIYGPNGIQFCQEPSNQYLDMLDEYGDDPRVVASQYVLAQSGPLAERGWMPDWEARDAREICGPNNPVFLENTSDASNTG